MARSLNKVELIGNLTRDPELRYTPAGTAVCTFGIATNRQWTTESGEKKDEAEFHRIVAWNKLGELCGQLLSKGRKVYVEGRLQTRKWAGNDGVEKTTTEIVISDMIILDSRGAGAGATGDEFDIPEDGITEEPPVPGVDSDASKKTAEVKKEKPTSKSKKVADAEENQSEDIPF